MLTRLASSVIRFRWWVIGAWTLIFLVSLLFAPRVTSTLKGGFGETDTEARRAQRQMIEALGTPESAIVLVFSSDTLGAADPRYIQSIERSIAPLYEAPQVDRIVTHFSPANPSMVAPDGRTTITVVELNTSIEDSVDQLPELRGLIQEGELDLWVTGGIAIFADLNAASKSDLRRAEIITLPLLAIALLVVFGSVVAAGLPVAMGCVSVVTTLALVFLMAQVTDMSIFVLNIASFLGLGMAVDYSLLMVSRFREELETSDTVDAVKTTMATAGKAVVFSASTSVIGLSGLLFMKFMMLRSLGIGGITVIAFSMLIALTLIPALLAVLGRRVDSLPIIRRRPGSGRFWLRLSGWVMRHPVSVIVPVTALLIVLGLPFLGVKLGTPWASMLPEDAESRVGSELVADRFGPGELAQVVVVETSETSTLSPANVEANIDFVERMQADQRVSRVDSLYTLDEQLTREQLQTLYALEDPSAAGGDRLAAALGQFASADRKTQLLNIVPSAPPVSEDTKSLVQDIRADPPTGDMKVLVTGVTPVLDDAVDLMYSDFPKVVLYVAVVTYLALFLLFRSAVLPLKAVALNVLSILASFGALVFVFQQGHFQELLGFTSEGYLEATVPILLFSVVFGLSMDYEVFLLSRVKEEYEATGDNTRSVSVGMERSGRIITSAALILIVVSGGFATGDILIVKALGFGTALTILIDSTIVRALLVPALMRLMSGLNWWAPRFLGGPVRPRV